MDKWYFGSCELRRMKTRAVNNYGNTTIRDNVIMFIADFVDTHAVWLEVVYTNYCLCNVAIIIESILSRNVSFRKDLSVGQNNKRCSSFSVWQ